jgi:hypothetical protein
MSLRLSLSVPPRNLPTAGVPTPRSRFPISLRLPLLAFSSMTPFSCASFLRASSRAVALASIPLLCDSGIFRCANRDSFAPKACNLKSMILSRFAVGVADGARRSRRWDSFNSRCRARSFLRFAVSVGSSFVSAGPVVTFRAGMVLPTGGGFELCVFVIKPLDFQCTHPRTNHVVFAF